MKRSFFMFTSLFLSIVLVLTACGGGNTSTSPSSSVSPSPSSGSTGGAKNDQAFTLRISSWFLNDDPQNQNYKDTAEKKFKEKYPNAKIEWEVLRGEKYFDKLKAELASGTAADIFFNQTVTQFGKAGYSMDLSNEPWVKNMVEVTKPFETYQGKIYGAAATIQSFGFFYNKKIFANLGISPPTNFKELLAIGEKIKAANIAPLIGGFKDQWTLQYLFGGYVQTAQALASDRFEENVYNGSKQLIGPETKSALDKLVQLSKSGMFNKSALSTDWNQSAIDFAAGKAAMIYQGPWMAGITAQNFESKGFEKFDVGFFPLTDENGNAIMGIAPDQSLSVNAKTKYVQEAKDMVAVLLGQDALSVHIKDVGFAGIKGIETSYAQPATKEMQQAINQNKQTIQWSYYYPESVKNSLLQIVTSIVSGKDYDAKMLEDVQRNYDRDKQTVVLPQ